MARDRNANRGGFEEKDLSKFYDSNLFTRTPTILKIMPRSVLCLLDEETSVIDEPLLISTHKC